MTRSSLIVTLDWPGTEESGVLVEDFLPVLSGVTKAVRLMVGHLGGRPTSRGRTPDWVRDQSRLRLSSTGQGSFVAELILDPPLSQGKRQQLPNYGEEAISKLCSWDGHENSTLPPAVTRCLRDVASGLSDGSRLWLGNDSEPRKVEVTCYEHGGSTPGQDENVRLQGWLKEVNWAMGTAQLHSYAGGHVRLQFDRSLAEDMLRLATQHVEVTGTGQFSSRGDHKKVTVETLSQRSRSWLEPFNLGTFLNASDLKVFRPDARLTVDMSDAEWQYFNRAIREGREI